MSIFSATAQWFANVEHLQQKAVNDLKKVRMIPEVCKLYHRIPNIYIYIYILILNSYPSS